MSSNITDRASGLGTGAIPNGENATISQKVPCRVATTENVTLAGLQTLDTVTVVADDRVLVKDQTDASENGIYLASADLWQRTSDCVDDGDLVRGSQVRVNQGALGPGPWYCTSPDPIVIGTDDITWADAASTDLSGAEIKALYEVEADAFTDAQFSKLAGIEPGATADQTDAEIQAAYNNQVSVVSQAEAEAGTHTTVRRWTALRVAQAAAANGGGGAANFVTSRTALKALDTSSISTVQLVEDGRSGMFTFESGNFATQVSGDTLEGVYIKADDTATTAGAWVRVSTDIINVLWFGAVGDGSTDATTAIQAAIDYAESLVVNFTRGATVLLPPGGYFLSAALTINSNQITIKGYGQASMLIRTTNYGNLFTIVSSDPDNTKIVGIQLRDFYVLCKTNPMTTGALIHVTRASRMYISNVSLQDGYVGIYLLGCDNVWMSDIDVQSGQRYAALQSGSANIRIDPWDNASAIRSQSANIYMDNVQLKTDESDGFVEHALFITGVDGLYIANSHIGFTRYAIRLAPFDNDAVIQHIHFTNTYIDGNVEQSDYLLFVQDALSSPPHTGLFENITFTNCGFVRPDLQCIVIISDTAEKFIFDGCLFEGGNADCLQVNSGGALSNSIFSNCVFDNWNRNGGSAWELRFLSGNTSDNIQFSACQFLSSLVNENAAFAGSENDIRFDNCKFSKTSFGGTTSGKNLRNVNASGMTNDLSENRGSESVTVDANAQGTIAHGLCDTPSVALVGLRADTTFEVQVTSVNSTNINVRVHNASGGDVAPASFTVQWMAKV